MYNLWKNIFGFPTNNGGAKENKNAQDDLGNDFRNPIWGTDDYSDDEGFEGFRHGHMSFPVLTDPLEMHKFFEHHMDEMLKRFGMFGWGEQDPQLGGSFFQDIEGPKPAPGAGLRESFLKPGYEPEIGKNAVKEDTDLDGKLEIKDLDQLFSKNSDMAKQQHSKPTIYAKSVFVRTIHRPDGSVETVRKVKDHTGHEETTVTQDFRGVQTPAAPLSELDQDIAGLSIFKKFFPF